ncbi:hypothetical protein FGB62_9g27 [Gracilaria domingensis]|nr:hypothetical protein FGB62_9g27 [Gracilaria domingensis]
MESAVSLSGVVSLCDKSHCFSYADRASAVGRCSDPVAAAIRGLRCVWKTIEVSTGAENIDLGLRWLISKRLRKRLGPRIRRRMFRRSSGVVERMVLLRCLLHESMERRRRRQKISGEGAIATGTGTSVKPITGGCFGAASQRSEGRCGDGELGSATGDSGFSRGMSGSVYVVGSVSVGAGSRRCPGWAAVNVWETVGATRGGRLARAWEEERLS